MHVIKNMPLNLIASNVGHFLHGARIVVDVCVEFALTEIFTIERKVTYVGKFDLNNSFWPKEEILEKGIQIISLK